MALEVNTAQESTSLKKSIILRAKQQGDVKVVLVKHYQPCSDEKEKETETALTKDDAPSKACKRKSLEMASTKETNEQCPSGKRRRSVPLTGATKPTVPLVQDLAQNTPTNYTAPVIDGNVCHMQNARLSHNTMQASSKKDCQSAVEVLKSTTHGNETLDFMRNDWQPDKLVDDFQDCVLLPNWSNKTSTEGLINSSRIKQDEHKNLCSVTDLDSPQVKNSRKCKSIFETYQLSKVHKSIVDEM